MTTLSLADARANLSKLVESAVATHERFEVTRNGDRAVVLLSAEDYDALLETVDVLSRAEEVQALRTGLTTSTPGGPHHWMRSAQRCCGADASNLEYGPRACYESRLSQWSMLAT